MNIEHLNSTPARWYTLLGLLLVPLLVAGGFLLAGVNADSQDATPCKAAVVNLDDPVTIDGPVHPARPAADRQPRGLQPPGEPDLGAGERGRTPAPG